VSRHVVHYHWPGTFNTRRPRPLCEQTNPYVITSVLAEVTCKRCRKLVATPAPSPPEEP